jgi:hypothetical protein
VLIAPDHALRSKAESFAGYLSASAMRPSGPTSPPSSQALLPRPAQASSTDSPGRRTEQQRDDLRALFLHDEALLEAGQAPRVARASGQDRSRRREAELDLGAREGLSQLLGQGLALDPWRDRQPERRRHGASREVALGRPAADRATERAAQPAWRGGDDGVFERRAFAGGEALGEATQHRVGVAARALARLGAHTVDRLGDGGEARHTIEKSQGVHADVQLRASARRAQAAPLARLLGDALVEPGLRAQHAVDELGREPGVARVEPRGAT